MTQGRRPRRRRAAPLSARPRRRLYSAMPLFHGNALMATVGAALCRRRRIALRRKFSASGFLRRRPPARRHVLQLRRPGPRLRPGHARPPESATTTLQFALRHRGLGADIGRVHRRFGCRVVEGYGSSEGVMRDQPDARHARRRARRGRRRRRHRGPRPRRPARSARRPGFDDDGRLLNADEAIGEIVGAARRAGSRATTTTPRPTPSGSATAEYWSGDLAYRDEDGFFYFAGRSADWLAGRQRELRRRARSSGSWSAGTGWRSPPSSPCPTPHGDQVMCALETARRRQLRPEAFTAFLDAQADLGTKWRPRFVRIVTEIPTTGNSKVAKQVLRRAAWVTTDPVYVRDGASTAYRPLTTADVQDLEKQFADNGRTALLPAA